MYGEVATPPEVRLSMGARKESPRRYHAGANRLSSHLVATMEGQPDASLSYCVLQSQTKEFVNRINKYFLK